MRGVSIQETIEIMAVFPWIYWSYALLQGLVRTPKLLQTSDNDAVFEKPGNESEIYMHQSSEKEMLLLVHRADKDVK